MVVLIKIRSGRVEALPGRFVADRRFPDTVEIPPCAR